MNKCTERLYNGLVKENPTFVLMLGMCPTLAVTTSAINGVGMGLSTTVVLIMSNMLISMLRKIIPDSVRMPAFIVIVASFVTIVQFLMEGFVPSLYDSLGLYIPLIVVNCIILGRAESYASKNPVLPSIFDGIGMGLGFTVGLTAIGIVRELIGAGKIFDIRVPKGWTVVQVLSFVNAETYDVYQQNMKATMMDQVNSADMVVFNRCDENSKRAEWRRGIKAVNRRAQIIFEMKDGSIAPDVNDEEDLPYDVKADVIELNDEDFGIWYVDAMDHPEHYDGKTIRFKGRVMKPRRMTPGYFVPGRKAMTCCADDTVFLGFLCRSHNVDKLKNGQWLTVTAKVYVEKRDEYSGEEGPVLYTKALKSAEPPEEEMVYF